jgi:hypothetical protein
MNNEIDLFANDEEIIIEIEPETAIAESQTAIRKARKPEEEKFSEGFYIRCTKAEKAAVEAEVEHFEMSIARFGIAKMLFTGRVLTREELKLFGGILQQLNSIGGNLNQIAHGLNAARWRGQTIEVSPKQLLSLTLEIQKLTSEFKTQAAKLWRS